MKGRSELDEARDAFFVASAALEVSPDARSRWLAAWKGYEAACLAAVEFCETSGMTEHEIVLGHSRLAGGGDLAFDLASRLRQ